MVYSDSSWVRYGVKSKSYMIFNIGLPSYEWHIIPTNPMSANQSINSAISPDHLISQIAVYIGSPKYLGIKPYLRIAVYVGLPNITASISESSFVSAGQKSRHHPSISPSIMVSTSTLDHRLSRFVMRCQQKPG